MGFGNSVSALLETYSNCLALLKAFKRRSSSDPEGPSYDDTRGRHNTSSGAALSRHGVRSRAGGSNGNLEEEQQALLRRSLKSDRIKVQRAYSARLSEAGSRLEKGDARAKSSLSRVLKKLTAAIVNLLHLSSRAQQTPVTLDYGSLITLSNASRVEAIRAIDQLSGRLSSAGSSRSGGSRASSARSSASSPSSPSSSSKKHSRNRSSGSAASSSSSSSSGRRNSGGSTSGGKSGKKASREKTSGAGAKVRKEQQDKTRLRKTDTNAAAKGVLPPRPTAPTPPPKDLHYSHQPMPRRGSSSPQGRRASSGGSAALPNRISLASISTDSTKLGEIPERKLLQRRAAAAHHPHGQPPRASASSGSSYDLAGSAGHGGSGGGSGDSSPASYYNVRPMYPLKPYVVPEVKERRFFGLFRRTERRE